jgi:titin
MLALFPPSSAALRRRFAATAAFMLVAAVAGMGQPAVAAEKDGRTPVPSKAASPKADKKADRKPDKKPTTKTGTKAGDKAGGKRDAKAGKAADDKAKTAATPGAARTEPAKAGKAAAPSPTPTPSASPAPSATPAPTPTVAAVDEPPTIQELEPPVVTGVESLNADIDATVTWNQWLSESQAWFNNYVVTASPGGKTCATEVGAATATSCTVEGLEAGTYTFTVEAVTEGGPGMFVSQPYEKAVAAPEPDGVKLTASFRDSTMEDHDWSAIKLLMKRADPDVEVTGLGYTVTLPDGLVVADTNVSLYCVGNVTLEEGGSTITLSGASLNSDAAECALDVAVTSAASGTYGVTAASVSGLTGGLLNTVTSQELTVTGALPRIHAAFEPTTVAAMAVADLQVGLKRTDENPDSSETGIGYQLALPGGLTVAAGQTANTCGGQLTATQGGGTVTLAGVTVTADDECYVQVPVSATAGGSYAIGDYDFSDVTNADPDLMSGCMDGAPGMAGEGCGPTLVVTKLAQSITFTPAASASLASGTYPLTATAGSQLQVGFSATPDSVCTVSGSTLTLVGVGTCQVTAAQSGNGTYNAATPVQRDIVVVPPPPSAPTLTAGISSLTATWSAPQDSTGITGYRVDASPGQATCTTKGATSCVLGGVAGTTYTVTVVALVGETASPASPVSNQATPTAPQPPATVPDTNLTLTTDQGLITEADPGEQIVFIGTGFAPHSTVVISIYSDPIVLGTAVTDALGNFSKPITVPRSLAAGAHTAVAQGVAPDGSPRFMKLAIQVVADGGSGGGLAVTGVPVVVILLIGLALVGAGSGLAAASRRRRVA